MQQNNTASGPIQAQIEEFDLAPYLVSENPNRAARLNLTEKQINRELFKLVTHRYHPEEAPMREAKDHPYYSFRVSWNLTTQNSFHSGINTFESGCYAHLEHLKKSITNLFNIFPPAKYNLVHINATMRAYSGYRLMYTFDRKNIVELNYNVIITCHHPFCNRPVPGLKSAFHAWRGNHIFHLDHYGFNKYITEKTPKLLSILARNTFYAVKMSANPACAPSRDTATFFKNMIETRQIKCGDSDSCPICCEKYSINNIPFIFNCSHAVCANCFSIIAAQNPNHYHKCPMCRAIIDQREEKIMKKICKLDNFIEKYNLTEIVSPLLSTEK